MAALVLNTDFFVNTNKVVMQMVCTNNTVDGSDYLVYTLSKLGISAKGLIGVYGWKHTTDNSVSVIEFPTTSVTAGVLTITVPAVTNNDPRFFMIVGTSGVNP